MTIKLHRGATVGLLGRHGHSALQSLLTQHEPRRVSEGHSAVEWILYRDAMSGDYCHVDDPFRPSSTSEDFVSVSYRAFRGSDLNDRLSAYEGQFNFAIPLKFLTCQNHQHWIYRITFHPGSDAAKEIMGHASFAPFRKGYVGTTGRNPLDRFLEHRRDVGKGVGHILHRAWHALGRETCIIPKFSLVINAPSREVAYDAEEWLVDTLDTVCPNGLNAIKGGMAGIRELWKLGLLADKTRPTFKERDAALVALERDQSPVTAHYRRGHIRKLPDRCSMRTTWVSAHWVGINARKEAA